MIGKRAAMLAALCAVVALALPVAAELVPVENGVTCASIVVFEDAPPFTRQSADELAEYIEKTSGARPFCGRAGSQHVSELHQQCFQTVTTTPHRTKGGNEEIG